MDTCLIAERKSQVATQQLINLKWWLVELSKHSSDEHVRTQLILLSGDTRKIIDNLLSDDFQYDASASTLNMGGTAA